MESSAKEEGGLPREKSAEAERTCIGAELAEGAQPDFGISKCELDFFAVEGVTLAMIECSLCVAHSHQPLVVLIQPPGFFKSVR